MKINEPAFEYFKKILEKMTDDFTKGNPPFTKEIQLENFFLMIRGMKFIFCSSIFSSIITYAGKDIDNINKGIKAILSDIEIELHELKEEALQENINGK